MALDNKKSASPNILIIAPTAYILGGVSVWLETILNGYKEQGINVFFGALDGEFHQADN